MNPYDADAAQYLGALYLGAAEWENSIKYYLMAIEIDPIMKKLWGGALLFGYVANGQLEEASKVMVYQLELNSTDSRPLGWSAFIYGLLGNKEKASDYLQKYLQLRPEIATADDYAKVMPEFLKKQALEGMPVAGLE